MRTTLMILSTIPAFAMSAVSASAQQTAGAPVSDSARAARQAAREAAANKPRTIDGINSVWIEDLTQPELRDMIRDGYTTVLILTGGVEDNSANLAMGKHNINNKLHGELIARRMGKTLVAPARHARAGERRHRDPARPRRSDDLASHLPCVALRHGELSAQHGLHPDLLPR